MFYEGVKPWVPRGFLLLPCQTFPSPLAGSAGTASATAFLPVLVPCTTVILYEPHSHVLLQPYACTQPRKGSKWCRLYPSKPDRVVSFCTKLAVLSPGDRGELCKRHSCCSGTGGGREQQFLPNPSFCSFLGVLNWRLQKLWGWRLFVGFPICRWEGALCQMSYAALQISLQKCREQTSVIRDCTTKCWNVSHVADVSHTADAVQRSVWKFYAAGLEKAALPPELL